eukprot:scaffold11319_cov61-Phaeocystis_antarctica.AAC.1
MAARPRGLGRRGSQPRDPPVVHLSPLHCSGADGCGILKDHHKAAADVVGATRREHHEAYRAILKIVRPVMCRQDGGDQRRQR